MLICDVATVGATAHALHLAVHIGLAGLISIGGGVFLALGIRASRRSRRQLAGVDPARPSRGAG